MADVLLLETIKDFLQKNVADHIKLQKADDQNVYNYTLVNPNVYVGWIPPKEYLPDGLESAIPCIIVGLDEGNDDGDEAELNIRLSFIVYSPGLHEQSQENFTPDFQGYKDLINLIERAKRELIRNRIIENETTVKFPFKWGMYQDQPYPYWYGWLTFGVTRQPCLYVPDGVEKLL